MIAVGNDELWKKFCAAIGLDGAPGVERYATNRDRVTQYAALRPLIAERLIAHSRGHWIDVLGRAGVPCGSVRDLNEVFEDPQLRARQMLASVTHQTIGALTVTGIPVKLSETPGEVRIPPPQLGEHTTAVLRDELGLELSEIDQLRQQQII